MSTDFIQAFPGIQIDGYHLVSQCPLCNERYSFRFFAGDLWECVACGENGDWQGLKKRLADDILVDISKIDAPKPPEGLIVVSEYIKPRTAVKTSTGFNPVDKMIGGLSSGMLTVMTGKRGEGKSTLGGQLALNVINEGRRVCFYSGELSAGTFRDWIVNQAAGPRFIEAYADKFGETRHRADQWTEPRILHWLGKKLIMYDNGIVKSSERNSIIERFVTARQIYGCDIFFVDNLMTAKIPIDQERDFYRAQSNFVRDLTEFAIKHESHVVLIAHPRKSIGKDMNDAIAGTADITNLASNVMAVSKVEDEEWDAELEVTKNREYGDTGVIKFNFDKSTRRFNLVAGDQIDRFGWEDEV